MSNLLLLLPLAAAEEHNASLPYIIGGGSLLFLFALLFGVMSFGKGREHS
jgi:hypothetical protein